MFARRFILLRPVRHFSKRSLSNDLGSIGSNLKFLSRIRWMMAPRHVCNAMLI